MKNYVEHQEKGTIKNYPEAKQLIISNEMQNQLQFQLFETNFLGLIPAVQKFCAFETQTRVKNYLFIFPIFLFSHFLAHIFNGNV